MARVLCSHHSLYICGIDFLLVLRINGILPLGPGDNLAIPPYRSSLHSCWRDGRLIVVLTVGT